MRKSVTIAGATAAPGKKAYGVVAVQDLFADGQPLEIPFIIINGSKDGPRLYVQVAQHPTEVYGLEGIRRVLADLDPRKLSGAITFSLPNPVGFRFATYFGRTITHDINRVLSGNPNGSVMERIVYTWWINFVKDRADYVIDFHGTPPETFIYYEAHGVSPGVPEEVAEKSERMAKIFGAKLLKKETEPYGGGKSFRGACVDDGIPAIVSEVAEDGAEVSERGLRNILVDLGMMEGEIELPAKQYILKWAADSASAGVNSKAGVFEPSVKIGDVVKKGDKVGIMYSPRTLQVTEVLTAHKDGYVSSIQPNLVKSVGESVMQIEEILEVIENR
jgi:predicted deacylase